MSLPLLEALTEYVLGTLDQAERLELEAQLARSPELQRELAAVRESLGHLPAALPPVAPRAAARESLLSALSSRERFRPFVPDLVRHFDLPAARVLELLGQVDDGASWKPAPLQGIALLHFQAGPNAVAPDTGFVRFVKGFRFPYHRHLGHEVNYVLEGAIRDGDGTLYLAGEAIVKGPGSAHDYVTSEHRETLIAVVQAGFEIVKRP